MGKKVRNNDRSVTIRLPIALYEAQSECTTLGDYRSVSQYVREVIEASVQRMQAEGSCEYGTATIH